MRGRYFRQNPTPIKPWYEKGGGARFSSDRALVEVSYPSLRFEVKDTRVSLEGNLTIIAECGIRTDIATILKFPWSYPDCEPVAFDAQKRFKAWPDRRIEDRHLNQEGWCCLWLPPCSPWDANDPVALRAFLDQLVVFYHRQLIYDATGIWPGQAYGHGRDGYVEFIRERLGGEAGLAELLVPIITRQVTIGRNDRCACGEDRKFKYCHLQVVEDFRRQIGLESLKRIFTSTK